MGVLMGFQTAVQLCQVPQAVQTAGLGEERSEGEGSGMLGESHIPAFLSNGAEQSILAVHILTYAVYGYGLVSYPLICIGLGSHVVSSRLDSLRQLLLHSHVKLSFLDNGGNTGGINGKIILSCAVLRFTGFSG